MKAIQSKFLIKSQKSTTFNRFANSKFSQIIPKDELKAFLKKNSWKYSNLNPINPEYSLSNLISKEVDESIKTHFGENLSQEGSDFFETYLGYIGTEFEHVKDKDELEFLYNLVEEAKISKNELINGFKILCGCEKFEEFLTIKFPTFKRYSGEGINSLIPMITTIVAGLGEKNSSFKEVVIAMGHRGRLNLLAMMFDYPVKNLLYKIDNKREIAEAIPGIDDMVTHIAPSKTKLYNINGDINSSKPIKVSMVHNPSHLEMTYPVGIGKVVAKRNDYLEVEKFSNSRLAEIVENEQKVAHIVVHGDAAISGQGVVYEALSMMNEENHKGSIHIVTNNQVGFTTEKQWTKPTDVFLGFDIPVIHVNANSLESVIKVGKIAQEYIKKFKKDIAINLIGWRKYGHNEVDEPSFTQPLMYKVIRSKQSLYKELREKLIKTGVLTEESIKNTENRFDSHLNSEFELSKTLKLTLEDTINPNYNGSKALTHKWSSIKFPHLLNPNDPLSNPKTGLNKSQIVEYIKKTVDIPKEFKLHPRLQNFYVNARLESINKNNIDWPTAESVAFASLLDEGHNVRISGQDVMRGTFSQRHIGLVDQNTSERHYPLESYYKLTNKSDNIKNQGRFEVNNSVLSELGVILFEYGYSLENPNNLVLWEAQFGDFANTGQLAFDNFIANGEAKWLRQSGLTIVLPHGYDGAGPEHSTSRIERFLQLVNHQGYTKSIPTLNNINMQVIQPTTAANYYHFLRRQMKLGFRKPLIVITPKVGLRHQEYNSKLEDFEDDRYKSVILDLHDKNDVSKIKTIVFTSGQSFLHFKGKDSLFNETVGLIRIEELAPFPVESIKNILSTHKFNKQAKIIWFQEESLNSGAFSYSEQYLRKILKETEYDNWSDILYVGREAQEGANGCVNDSKKEVQEILKEFKRVSSLI